MGADRPLGLLLVPLLAGSLRLIELAGGPALLPMNPRSRRLTGARGRAHRQRHLYAVLGAFQFSSTIRRRRPGWHRSAGRVLAVLGLLVALSALWMTHFYARPGHTGELLYVFRLAFGSSMAACSCWASRRSDDATSPATGPG